ncbi:MAG TPA: FHA domain-containing protein [Leptospiraceae bacterium]|nr:FHA domain-containing protein [Leptospiraceae bacterium]HNB99687.1 FHA domain-containing protein [Leptospiraceae bacterium]HNE07896.1 FHA domain-containing protein [Leptospiraceae bacterium]HNH02529.1 FHA domain-containing protein [Leptospiraceae bacterium]HNI88044.1 FHA domain-containing protein [Leptospiraceae bacterium]
MILSSAMSFGAGVFFLYSYYVNKKANANLSIAPGTLEEQLVHLGKNYYEIGREENSDTIKINSKKVSRRHAILRKKFGKFYITDVSSTNGTFLNNRKIEPFEEYQLFNEDEIRIGGVMLKFYNLTNQSF